MIYARAHDQTVADDYFAAMQRVEQRLELPSAPKEDPKTKETMDPEIVGEPEYAQVLIWVEQLAQPKLRRSERLEVATQLRQLLVFELQAHPPPRQLITTVTPSTCCMPSGLKSNLGAIWETAAEHN